MSAQREVLPACRNGHPRVAADGSSNVYHYPPREGRKPRMTCRICRDGVPRERELRPEPEFTIWNEFDLRPVRPRKAERDVYRQLVRYDLIDRWAPSDIDTQAITEEFVVAMNGRYPVRLRLAYALIIEAAKAKSAQLDAEVTTARD